MPRVVIDASEWLPGFSPAATAHRLAGTAAAPEPRGSKLLALALSLTAIPAFAQSAPVEVESSGPTTVECGPIAPWRPERDTVAVVEPECWPALDRVLLDRTFTGAGKYAANVAAIATLREVEAACRAPTDAERDILNCYTGWGSLPGAFNDEQQEDRWVERAQHLKSLLEPAEYQSCRASVLNSHYTGPAVIEAIWDAVRRLGFSGGRIIEPTAGVGYFVGLMPRDIAARSRVTAVEMDEISGRILKALYAANGVDVRIAPLERCRLPHGWYDLAIGNVPFGDYSVSDPAHRGYARFSIHNYCIGKAIDLVRPGGLVCVITSSYTMESLDVAARAYLASEAHLLGAIRLPVGAFQAIAGTDVQADVLFLRRRFGHETPSAQWCNRAKAPPSLIDGWSTREMYCNAYYVAHPDMVIGRMLMKRGPYGETATVVHDGPLGLALARCVALLPEAQFAPIDHDETRPATQAVSQVDATWRQGSYRLHNARIVRVVGGELVDVHDDLTAAVRCRIAGMIGVRDCLKELMRAQLESGDGDQIEALRGDLCRLYDRFVADYGYLTTRSNVRAIRGDPDLPLLLSLELWDEENETAEKAAIFTRNTMRRVEQPTAVATPEEALVASMAWRGRVDLSYMAGLLKSEPHAVSAHLEETGQIYLDPASSLFETADEYLSGNVRKKLDQALSAGSRFARNVAALDKVMPPELDAGMIVARLGAVWIPASDIEAFANHLFGDCDVSVRYSALAGTWSVKYNDWTLRRNVNATQAFGTARMHGMELIQDALNGQSPTVRDKDPKSDRYIVNRKETLAAREKLAVINEQFGTWIYDETERRERLVRRYNELFNSTRARQFDGSYLQLPGFSGAIDPYPHTLNGVARILQRGNTLAGHAVGSGKTALASIATMELRRLGLASKVMHVVPNSVVLQYAAEMQRLYPAASILIAGKEDLEKDRRREFCARIATGEWDAIVIAHSSFELIPMSNDHTARAIGEIIAEIETTVRSMGNTGGNRIVKQLESMKRRWKKRLEDLTAEGKKDDLVTFEELGVDYIVCDECHFFKNLATFSKLPRVPGMPSANSQRAFDMWLKTRYVMSLHGDQQRGVVFMTATFICNTVAEIHVFQRYLQPSRLAELGLETFDAWVSTFGEVVGCLELSPEGKGYRLASRLARFNNVPELMAIFTEVADIQTDEMLKLAKPEIEGGKPRVALVPSSSRLSQYVEGLVKRAEQIRNGQVDPSVDNMLAVTSDGRKAALDIRLVLPTAGEEPESKVNACVAEVFRIWNATAAQRLTQLVFCDFSTPKSEREFSVYHELKRKLVGLGVPDSEVRFVHEAATDAQRARLFRHVREGKIRVLIGSTDRMGVGTNVQDRVIAAHYLTIPWRPDQLQQADGRSIRPGNRNKVVSLVRYVREGSFDAYQYQLLETKARFIAQVLSGNKGIRSMEDVQIAALTYAEIKALASGNPLVIEKAGVDAEIVKLSSLFSVWREQRWRNESEIASMPAWHERRLQEIAAREEDLARVRAVALDSFSLTLDDRTHQGADAAGAQLRRIVLDAVDRLRASSNRIEEIVGRFGGLELGLYGARNMLNEPPNFFLKGRYQYASAPYLQGPSLVAGLIEALGSVAATLDHARAGLRESEQRKRDLERELSRPFEHEARLTALLSRQRELDALLDLDKSNDGGLEQEAA